MSLSDEIYDNGSGKSKDILLETVDKHPELTSNSSIPKDVDKALKIMVCDRVAIIC